MAAAGSVKSEAELSVAVSVIMGVPTVKREVQSYLLSTLQNLIESMSPQEQDDSVIVVLIAEVIRQQLSLSLWSIEIIHIEYIIRIVTKK